MHYLITGHTGFKGTWLALLLLRQGHVVSGLALDPPSGGLFEAVGLSSRLKHDFRIDIRNKEATAEAIQLCEPDVVFHLAAQPLVRESYRDPRYTYEVNVTGTLNVLDAVRSTPSVRAHVVITTDKVYRNVNQVDGYVETDPLGGEDPYSSSKAMADLLTQSWTQSFPGAPTAIARAGNVIGGGDVSPERLLVDLISNSRRGLATEIRYPNAVRPWQHVLDCLAGYLSLANELLNGRGEGEWNFGPGRESFVTVGEVADRVVHLWGGESSWFRSEGEHFPEAGLLALDASKAITELQWTNVLPFPESLEWTVEWYKMLEAGETAFDACERQIRDFENLVGNRSS